MESPIASRTRSKRMKMTYDIDMSEYIKNSLIEIQTIVDINTKTNAILDMYDTILQVEKYNPVKNDIVLTSKFYNAVYVKLYELENELIAINMSCNVGSGIDFNKHYNHISELKKSIRIVGETRGFN